MPDAQSFPWLGQNHPRSMTDRMDEGMALDRGNHVRVVLLALDLRYWPLVHGRYRCGHSTSSSYHGFLWLLVTAPKRSRSDVPHSHMSPVYQRCAWKTRTMLHISALLGRYHRFPSPSPVTDHSSRSEKGESRSSAMQMLVRRPPRWGQAAAQSGGCRVPTSPRLRYAKCAGRQPRPPSAMYLRDGLGLPSCPPSAAFDNAV